ncbi:MAG: hypothetical protein U9Q80_02150 [Bacillota bacterium]|nr:hypothetical protein [Bacillota bacterium]
MAATVYQTNKKTGITYAYESVSYWDKEKRQSRAKRKCIGKVDPITKEIIPTRKKNRITKNKLILLNLKDFFMAQLFCLIKFEKRLD